MATKRRRVAIEKIENPAARNVCFSKRRNGLFRKASELCRLDPSFSVHAIVFSPAGKPFLFGNPEALSNPDLPRHYPHEISSLLAVDISTLNRAELESHADQLRQLKSSLLSKNCSDHDQDGFMRLSDVAINSEFYSQFTENVDVGVESEFKKLRYMYEFFGEDDSFTKGSELGMDYANLSGNKSDNVGINSEFGSQYAEYMDSISLSELGVDSEFEKLRYGYEFLGENDSFTKGLELGVEFGSEIENPDLIM